MKTKFDHVLLVDDDKTASFIHEHFFRYFQVAENIDKVTNGQEAINFMQEHWHQLPEGEKLITIDLNMPVMDGYGFLNFLVSAYGSEQHLPNDVHLVVLTSSASYKDKQLAAQYPLLDYIEKPLTKAKIDRILKRLTWAQEASAPV